mmetsp:Transcript_24368/g.62140  ORF Transcript_24368/g.62140 Transcript_24368/m.62140 type:complete len:637 (-) Transcript_24368:135-2045(-)
MAPATCRRRSLCRRPGRCSNLVVASVVLAPTLVLRHMIPASLGFVAPHHNVASAKSSSRGLLLRRGGSDDGAGRGDAPSGAASGARSAWPQDLRLAARSVVSFACAALLAFAGPVQNLGSPLPAFAEDVLNAEERVTVSLFEQNTPGVVFITSEAFEMQGVNDQSMRMELVPQGSGSGWVFDLEGHIVTNYHVIQNSNALMVRFIDGTEVQAKVIGGDPMSDVAVLKVELPKGKPGLLRPLIKGDSSGLRVGQEVYAIGNPFGLDHTLTKGVVSGVGRTIMSFGGRPIQGAIQTDASINPGNSGGPVFDARGHCAGVAFCKDVRHTSDNIGYVIPAEVVRCFLQRCDNKDGYIMSPSVPYRWHKLENQSLRSAHKVPDGISGVLLTSVAPAMDGALQVGDVLTHIDGRSISDDGQIQLRGSELIQHRYLLRNKRIGEPTVFRVFREGQQVEPAAVQLCDLPPICPRWPDVDYLPEYLILGALALVPLAQSHVWYKECHSELKATIYRWNRRWPGDRDNKEGLVLLVTVFAHELTFGYRRGWRIVESYNGISITSLRHLRELWHKTRDEVSEVRGKQRVEAEKAGVPYKPVSPGIFVRLGLQSEDDIWLDASACIDAEQGVLKTHAIERPSFIRGDT